MKIKLIKGSYEYKEQIIEMLKEWKEYNDTHEVNCSPGAIFKNNYDDFDYYLSNLETSEPKSGLCKSQYKNVGLGQYKNVGFPTFLYCLFSLHLL